MRIKINTIFSREFCDSYQYDVVKKYATGVNILELVEEAKEKETIVIPETIDGIRAACEMQKTREEGTSITNKYLKIGLFK